MFNEIDKEKCQTETKCKLKQIGEIIRKKRIEKGMSQDNLAFNCQTDKSFINKIERGVYVNVTIYTLYKIAEGLCEHITIFF